MGRSKTKGQSAQRNNGPRQMFQHRIFSFQ